jgi:hypothetical protein
MGSKADEYRRRSKDAEEQAKDVQEAAAKIAWLNIARHWRDMADQAERNGW